MRLSSSRPCPPTSRRATPRRGSSKSRSRPGGVICPSPGIRPLWRKPVVTVRTRVATPKIWTMPLLKRGFLPLRPTRRASIPGAPGLPKAIHLTQRRMRANLRIGAHSLFKAGGGGSGSGGPWVRYPTKNCNSAAASPSGRPARLPAADIVGLPRGREGHPERILRGERTTLTVRSILSRAPYRLKWSE